MFLANNRWAFLIENNLVQDFIEKVLTEFMMHLNANWTVDMVFWQCLILKCIQVSRNIVMEAHLIRTTHFIGITCTVFQHHEVSQGLSELAQDGQLNFRCSTGSHNTSLINFPLKVKHHHLHPANIKAYITTLCKIYFHLYLLSS